MLVPALLRTYNSSHGFVGSLYILFRVFCGSVRRLQTDDAAIYAHVGIVLPVGFLDSAFVLEGDAND